MTVTIAITRLSHAEGLPLPAYATPGSAGMDLCAAVEVDTILAPLERLLVPTGLCIALPDGYEAQVRPRSGLAYKNGVTVLNAPGTIDADYRGEVKALLVNLSKESFVIQRGMRIAQLIIAPVTQGEWAETHALDDTARAGGGFGSTGV